MHSAARLGGEGLEGYGPERRFEVRHGIQKWGFTFAWHFSLKMMNPGEHVSPRDKLKTGLLQLGAWNLQGKPLPTAIDVLDAFGLDMHVLALQEVGGVAVGEALDLSESHG